MIVVCTTVVTINIVTISAVMAIGFSWRIAIDYLVRVTMEVIINRWSLNTHGMVVS